MSDGSCFIVTGIKTKRKDKEFEIMKNDDVNSIFNQKIVKSSVDSKSSLVYKTRYFNTKLEYSQVARQSFLVRSFKGSNPFIPISLR